MSTAKPNTVALADFRPRTADNRHALDQWALWRAGKPAPFWSTFDPLELTSVVGQSIFMKYIDDENWTVSLFGSELVSRFGADLTGLNILDVLEPANREQSVRRMKFMREAPAIICSVNEMKSAMDVPLVVEWLLLPFYGSEGEVTRSMLVVDSVDQVPPARQLIDDEIIGRTILDVEFVSLREDASLKDVG